MNYTLKPPPLMAHVLPGFYALFLLALAVLILAPDAVPRIPDIIRKEAANPSEVAAYTLLGFVTAWLVGLTFDGFRHGIWESIADKWIWPSDGAWWDIFFKLDQDQLDRITESYYSYYVLDANIAFTSLGIALLLIIRFLWLLLHKQLIWEVAGAFIFTLVLTAVFARDALVLRRELRSLAEKLLGIAREFPHDGVYTRLRPSKTDTDGVGVFAIRNIPKGSPIFRGDENEQIVWIRKDETGIEPEAIKNMYEDFCIKRRDEYGRVEYGCPASFNLMTISWYLNDTKDEAKLNVDCDKEFVFWATRDIEEGEELLVDYDTYSH
jgi:hypothetical protein